MSLSFSTASLWALEGKNGVYSALITAVAQGLSTFPGHIRHSVNVCGMNKLSVNAKVFLIEDLFFCNGIILA